jgi:hypothetical protein
MNSHLSTFHKDIKFIRKNDKTNENMETPSSIKNALMNKNSYDAESDKFKSLTEYVVNFVTDTNQLLSIEDHPAFIKLMNKFDHKYKLPGRQTITNKNVNERAEKVKALI